MKPCVFGRRQKRQVVYIIIARVFVDVVHVVASLKFSPDLRFDDLLMFVASATFSIRRPHSTVVLVSLPITGITTASTALLFP